MTRSHRITKTKNTNNMKKIYILMIAILIGGISNAQSQNQPTKPKAQDIINKTLSDKIPQYHFPEHIKSPKASKSVCWNFDTIVTFDAGNNPLQRHTQTFDANGNMLTGIEERWQINSWVNYYKRTCTYDTNGNKLTDLRENWQINAWVNDSRSTFTYDANGNMLTILYEGWQNNTWVNNSRYTYTYDAYGNKLTDLYENWIYNAWENVYRYTYTFNANGNKLTDLFEQWQSNAWVNNSRHTYTYDVNGNKLTDLFEQWQNNAWVNNSRYTYTYDVNGNELTCLRENWQNNAWVNELKYTYTYDVNGNILTQLYKSWQNNIWVNNSRYTYTYDVNGNKLTYLYEQWQNNTWVDNSRYTYTYDVNGNMLTCLREDWQINIWVNNFRYTYTYDANGNMLTYKYEKWQYNAWVNNFKYTYTYDAYGNSISGKYEIWQNNNWILSEMEEFGVYSSKTIIIELSTPASFVAHFIYTNPIPQAADTITGSSVVCQGQTSVTYSVPTITNATSYIWTLPSGASGTSNTNTITVNYSTYAVSGSIAVKGSNSFGTGDSSSLAITVNPLPIAAGLITSLNNDSVSINENNVLYSVPLILNATTYEWTYSGLGATFVGGNITTTNNITINFSSTASSGNLTVKGHNSCGDGVISSNYPIYVSSVGITDNNNSFNCKIYPNPASDNLIIESDRNKLTTNAIISVYDIQGKLLLQQKIMQQQTELNISQFAKGIYIIKINNDKETMQSKFVKE